MNTQVKKIGTTFIRWREIKMMNTMTRMMKMMIWSIMMRKKKNQKNIMMKRKMKLITMKKTQKMPIQLDQAQILNANMEKKAKQCDRIVGEWKQKVDGLSMDLDAAQNETRSVSSELFKIKNAYDEALLQLEEVRRENKTLSNEIKDILDQITEGGRSIHEIDKIRKRLE